MTPVVKPTAMRASGSRIQSSPSVTTRAKTPTQPETIASGTSSRMNIAQNGAWKLVGGTTPHWFQRASGIACPASAITTEVTRNAKRKSPQSPLFSTRSSRTRVSRPTIARTRNATSRRQFFGVAICSCAVCRSVCVAPKSFTALPLEPAAAHHDDAREEAERQADAVVAEEPVREELRQARRADDPGEDGDMRRGVGLLLAERVPGVPPERRAEADGAEGLRLARGRCERDEHAIDTTTLRRLESTAGATAAQSTSSAPRRSRAWSSRVAGDGVVPSSSPSRTRSPSYTRTASATFPCSASARISRRYAL